MDAEGMNALGETKGFPAKFLSWGIGILKEVIHDAVAFWYILTGIGLCGFSS
jgi:hypothetical protein